MRVPSAWAAALLLISALPARADVMHNGGYSLEKSLNPAASGDVSGPSYLSSMVVGGWTSSLAPQAGGAFTIFGSFLTIPPSSLNGPLVVGLKAAGAYNEGSVLVGVGFTIPVEVLFNEDMLPSSLNPTSIITVSTRDATYLPVFTPQNYGVGYVPPDFAALMSPTTSWSAGNTMSVLVTSDVADFEGIPLSTPVILSFEVMHASGTSNVVTSPFDPNLQVVVPAGVFNQPFTILISSNPSNPGIAEATRKVEEVQNRQVVRVIDLSAVDALGNLIQGPFPNYLTLRFPYPSSVSNPGIVSGFNLRADTLALWRLDQNFNIWVRQPDPRVDTTAKLVSASLNHFSIYSLIGGQDTDVSNVYCFPIPFRPNSNNPARYGTWANGITFANLPSTGWLRIYTVDGVKVREYDLVGAPQQQWDVRNSVGQIVGSGVYLWEVSSGGNVKTGKLMVIR